MYFVSNGYSQNALANVLTQGNVAASFYSKAKIIFTKSTVSALNNILFKCRW